MLKKHGHLSNIGHLPYKMANILNLTDCVLVLFGMFLSPPFSCQMDPVAYLDSDLMFGGGAASRVMLCTYRHHIRRKVLSSCLTFSDVKLINKCRCCQPDLL